MTCLSLCSKCKSSDWNPSPLTLYPTLLLYAVFASNFISLLSKYLSIHLLITYNVLGTGNASVTQKDSALRTYSPECKEAIIISIWWCDLYRKNIQIYTEKINQDKKMESKLGVEGTILEKMIRKLINCCLNLKLKCRHLV